MVVSLVEILYLGSNYEITIGVIFIAIGAAMILGAKRLHKASIRWHERVWGIKNPATLGWVPIVIAGLVFVFIGGRNLVRDRYFSPDLKGPVTSQPNNIAVSEYSASNSVIFVVIAIVFTLVGFTIIRNLNRISEAERLTHQEIFGVNLPPFLYKTIATFIAVVLLIVASVMLLTFLFNVANAMLL